MLTSGIAAFETIPHVLHYVVCATATKDQKKNIVIVLVIMVVLSVTTIQCIKLVLIVEIVEIVVVPSKLTLMSKGARVVVS